MFTASLRRLEFAILLACALCAAWRAEAHPVAQGGLAVAIFPDRVSVRARVSMEEVLVAAAYRKRTQGESSQQTPAEAIRSHGPYLLRHLRVSVNGQALDGRIAQTSATPGSLPEYALDYRSTGGPAVQVVLEQDVLREFEYAPGNPWEATYLVRIGSPERVPQEESLLTSREPLEYRCEWTERASCTSSRDSRTGIAGQYVRHGIAHILAGYDHLLFIAALVLAVATILDLVKVVSAFTLAHSITLTLSVLDVFRLPGQLVEPMIAASIVIVALQNVLAPERSRGAVRLAVAFFFGLFHGLGFAGGLLGAMQGISGATAGWAIGGFSLGVEIGHLLIVVPLFAALWSIRNRGGARAIRLPGLAQRYGSVGICAAGMSYLISALH